MSDRDFEIALPDGRAIVVAAPDEHAARQAAHNFLMREGGTKRGEQGGVDNFVRSVARGASLGFADEVAAAGDATVGPAIDWGLGKLGLGKTNTSTAPTWSERYGENLSRERGQDKAYDDTSPVWSGTGKVTGGIGGALATLPRWLLAAGPGIPGMAKSAAAGGVLGGVAGFGDGEGGLGERVESAGEGAAFGTAAGGILHPVTSVVGNVGRAVAESAPGRYVADNIITPGFRAAADMVDRMAPKMRPASLSAAAPEGGQVPVDSFATTVADSLRGAATTGEDILSDAAARRIADALRRGGSDVPGMRARLDQLGPDAMPLDTNPMTQRLGRTAYISPGEAPEIIETAMDARNRATGGRVAGTVREAMGDSGPAVLESARMRGQRSAQGRVDFEEAVGPDAPYRISPEMRQVMQDAPVLQETMDRIMSDAAGRGVRLTPAQVAHRVKRQLAADADAAFSSGRAINKDDVGSLADRWRTALHDANPAIREADAAWQARSDAMDALDLGRQFMRQGTGEIDDAVSPAVLAERIPLMTAEEAQAFIAGAADTLTTKAHSGLKPARQVVDAIHGNDNLRSKLVSMLGQANADRLFNRAMSERAFARTDRVVRGGSDTTSKILSAMDDAAGGEMPTSVPGAVSRALSGMARAYNKHKAGNEQVRARIARMLTETDAVENEAALERIAAQLSMIGRQRRAVTRGGASAAGQEF